MARCTGAEDFVEAVEDFVGGGGGADWGIGREGSEDAGREGIAEELGREGIEDEALGL